MRNQTKRPWLSRLVQSAAWICGAAGLLATVLGQTRAQTQPPLSFALAPPVAQNVTLTPSSGTSAQLSLTFLSDSRLGATLPVNIGDTPVTLTRSGAGAFTYTGAIPFDFTTFESEQAARQAAANTIVPVFSQRELESESGIAFLDPTSIAGAVPNHLALNVPLPIGLGGPAVVHPERELFITDPSVVQDPVRTFDVCTGAGNPAGAWTFGTLMTAMANQPLTLVNPATFVEKWLDQWTANQTANGWKVPARPGISGPNDLLGFWPRAGGLLDLTRAPLRLLAIVNRLDLRNNGLYGGGNAGEGRFIFQVVQPPGPGHAACTPQPFTVILEYGVPIMGCNPVLAWAQQWHALGGIGFGAAFNAALQAITNVFTAANANPAKENGSALDQLRTDETQLVLPKILWQLRQFDFANATNGLPFDNLLHEAPVTQTPETVRNLHKVIATYLNTPPNPGAILSGAYQVPAQFPVGSNFLGGSSENLQQAWNGVPTQPTDARNLLSLNTCNGCHGAETQTGQFLHAQLSVPLPPGVPAALSQFLLGAVPPSTLAALGVFTIPDPVSGVPRSYGDLLRRQTDLAAEVGASCFAGNPFVDLNFFPILAAD